MRQLLSAYGHSWVDSTGASAPESFMAERASRQLGLALANHGMGGTVSTETAALLRRAPADSSAVFLLMTGLNDARIHGQSTHAEHHYKDALQCIFAAFRDGNSGGLVIAVQQPHLLDYSLHAPANKGSSELIDRYNSILRETAKEWPAVTVATTPGWDARTMLDNDTVHPNTAGHAYLADVVTNVARTARRR